MDALTAAGIEYKLNPSGAVSVPESKVQEARIRLASQGLPQSDSMGIEMIQKDSALGTQLDDGERALPVGARNRTRAHHRQGSGRAERAGTSGAAQTLGVSARCAQGDRLGDAAAVSRPAPRTRPGRRHRAPGRLERAGTGGERRDAGGSGRILAQFARTKARKPPPAPGSSSTRASSRKAISSASSSCSNPWSAPAACAPPSRPTWTSRSPRRRTRTTIRRRRRCAASRPATRRARAATAPKASPAR